MRWMMGAIIALLVVVIGLQLRLIDVATKARDATEETAYMASLIEARWRERGTRAAREPVRPFWDRLTDDRDADRRLP
jgi:hypothetical protein